MTNRLLIVFLLVTPSLAYAQLSEQSRQELQTHEDTLSQLIEQAINDSVPRARVAANYEFIPRLVNVLKIRNSFHYPFDSLGEISIQYPADSSFRIFSWMVDAGRGSYRHFGAIQMNRPKLKLHPLIDYSDSLYKPIDTFLGNRNWYGAYYYNIRQFESDGKDYYLLFGYDPNDPFSDIKLMDVLRFAKRGEPQFGAPVFHYQTEKEDEAQTHYRFFIEYKSQAGPSLNYNKKRDAIVFDHLVPPDSKSKGSKFLYVPDGTYEGFELKNGMWRHIDKIFHYSIGEPDNPPVPHPKEKASDNMKGGSRKER